MLKRRDIYIKVARFLRDREAAAKALWVWDPAHNEQSSQY